MSEWAGGARNAVELVFGILLWGSAIAVGGALGVLLGGGGHTPGKVLLWAGVVLVVAFVVLGALEHVPA